MISEKKRRKIAELADKINYPTSEHSHLIDAMNAETRSRDTKGKNNKEIMNDAMATVGDAILKEVISTNLYNESITSGELTEKKKVLEDNATQKKVGDALGLEKFAYKNDLFGDELPMHDKPKTAKEHYPYLEAIIAAMYYDAGYEKTRCWIEGWLWRRLEDATKK